jgi:hypothetical protein
MTNPKTTISRSDGIARGKGDWLHGEAVVPISISPLEFDGAQMHRLVIWARRGKT